MQLYEAQKLLEQHGPGNVKVVYRSHPEAAPEEGVITSVTGAFVFVRYGADVHSKATRPEDLNQLWDSDVPDRSVCRNSLIRAFAEQAKADPVIKALAEFDVSGQDRETFLAERQNQLHNPVCPECGEEVGTHHFTGRVCLNEHTRAEGTGYTRCPGSLSQVGTVGFKDGQLRQDIW